MISLKIKKNTKIETWGRGHGDVSPVPLKRGTCGYSAKYEECDAFFGYEVRGARFEV